MHAADKRLYRHVGPALLRAAATPIDRAPGTWPDLADARSCEAWLAQVWAETAFADMIRAASPALANRIDVLDTLSPKQIRRACASVVRYVLRATSRHTPFGLFAGVTTAAIAATSEVRWGDAHRAIARVDTQWLGALIDRLEEAPDLVARLDVVFTDLAIQRGARLEAPRGPNVVSIRHTSAVEAAQNMASSPIRFADLAAGLGRAFPAVPGTTVTAMLTELVRQQFLVTCLRAPTTVTDPLHHLLDRLSVVGADDIDRIAPLLEELRAIDEHLRRHNNADTDSQVRARAVVARRMRDAASVGRTPLALDLRLDCDVTVPRHVVGEAEDAASVLARLSRQPTGEPAWRDFYTTFCDTYGTGTLVPVADVVHPDSGIGYPSGYPGSVLPARSSTGSERDETLLTLAWTALADREQEIVLDESSVRSLAVGDPETWHRPPPHVEIAARVHASSTDELDRGNYLITVIPARAWGTFTSRFAALASDSRLHEAYSEVPTDVVGALPVQLSVPPAYAHAENICRVPPYLPDVLALGEHHRSDRSHLPLTIDDLAVTATRGGLHLVSVSQGRVIEPQAFHGLALDKQLPPLARFLIHLSRGIGLAWHKFDWGPHAQQLPYLPRVRHRRAILAPARWRLTGSDLPNRASGASDVAQGLKVWRQRWSCPDIVELTDSDRTLRLDLTEPAHAAILHSHVARHGYAQLTEAASASQFGWIGGHAHEIVLPMAATRSPAPASIAVTGPVTTRRDHGQLPGAPGSEWLNAKIYTHPTRVDDLITDHIPRLLDDLDDPAYWYVRYRSPHETDHLRLRLRTSSLDAQAAVMLAVGAWSRGLRTEGVIRHLVIDTYRPETGRYGQGVAMTAAENVFVADSRAVAAQLRHLSDRAVARDALAAINTVATAHGLLGDLADAMRWLVVRPAPDGPPIDRAALQQINTLLGDTTVAVPTGWDRQVILTWEARSAALAAYRPHLVTTTDLDTACESLLHMHHNRAIGVDRDREARCRRLARHAALGWIARCGADR